MRKLFLAHIYHRRTKPGHNEFSYKGFFIRFDIAKISELENSVFKVNRFGLFSFYEKDYAHKGEGSLYDWALSQLHTAGVRDCDHIELQTFPRVLGYVFNPVSFWYCYYQEKLQAVICEVNNTFGESHNYLIRGESGCLPKEFHVSPFFRVEGEYQFKFERENRATILYYNNSELALETSIAGEEIAWNVKNFIKLFFRYPFFTFVIVFLIHFQALKLWLKKVQFYSLPKKLKKDLTYE